MHVDVLARYLLENIPVKELYLFRKVKQQLCTCLALFLVHFFAITLHDTKGLFTWSGGPRSSGVGFFCFHALGDTKQKKLTPLDRGPPLHVNRV